MNKFIARFIIIFVTIFIASTIAKYFDFSIVDSVCIGFITGTLCNIIIED